jgi:hypothetical protein
MTLKEKMKREDKKDLHYKVSHEGREDGHPFDRLRAGYAHEEILFSPQSHRGHGE